MVRWLLAVGLMVAGCSFIADFDPNKGGAGATGTDAGGGTGGQPMDGPVADGRRDRDASPPDSAIDARVECTSSDQCDDGIYCTIDHCSFQGICVHESMTTQTNNRCALPTQCTYDVCDPSNPAHDSNGCVHTPVQCPTGEACDATQGCISVQCTSDEQCPSSGDCCQVPHCRNNGSCTDTPLCGSGQICIYSTAGCTCL